MAKTNKNMVWWLILGLIIVFVFLPKSGFLGSLLTVCDNTEPADYASFTGTATGVPIVLNVANGTAQFQTKFDPTGLHIVNIGSENCNALISYINGTKGAYGLHEYKISNGLVYWCNKAGTTILYTADPNVIAGYYTKYEICRTQNYTGTAYEADPLVCAQKFGNWTNNKCVCPDGSQLKINDECEQLTSINVNNSTTNTDTDFQDLIDSTRKTDTTTTKTTTTTTTTPPPAQTDRTTVYIIGGIAAIAVIYLGYSVWFKKKKR